jgi:hypothetical protein
MKSAIDTIVLRETKLLVDPVLLRDAGRNDINEGAPLRDCR